MARNRMIKPDFWSDSKIGRISPLARLLFIALWNFSDDFGISSASPRRILGECFENDEGISELKVKSLLKELVSESLIESYYANDKEWISVKNWEKHQKIDRRSARKNPSIEEASADPRSEVGVESSNKEKEKEKEKEKGCAEARLTEPFDFFWKVYPKKVGEKDCRNLFGSISSDDHEDLLKAVENYKLSKSVRDNCIRNPFSFLKNGWWRDWIDQNPDPIKTDDDDESFYEDDRKLKEI